MKPYIHAMSSAKRFGGTPENYLDLHEFLDSSKAAMGDNRHRALTHNAWFIRTIPELVFGVNRVNSDGKTYSVRDVCEQHVAEDMRGTIPTACDYLSELEMKPWINGDGVCPSHRKLVKPRKTKLIKFPPKEGVEQ
jgi:hypothetical protein